MISSIPIVGYKWFKWAGHPPMGLRPPVFLLPDGYHVHSDDPSLFVAVCIKGGEHPAPDLECSCGIYAFLDAARAVGYWADLPPIFALVALGGRVIEHKDSVVRAEYCRPLALIVNPENPQTAQTSIELLADLYDCPAAIGRDHDGQVDFVWVLSFFDSVKRGYLEACRG